MSDLIINLLRNNNTNRVLTALAPMDGYTDVPFRSICRSFGADILYTEFIHGLDIQYAPKLVAKKLVISEKERPIGFQIYDNEPARIVKAAKYLETFSPDFIDINLGCSINGIKSRGAGAGMLKNPRMIANLMHELTTTLKCPVSAKIRLGWDHQSLNYDLVSGLLEQNGASFIAVHGRTAADKFSDPVNWQAIREIKEKLSIPVIGNGNIIKLHDIFRMHEHTNCDAVMIGRSAIGNPWIFDQTRTGEPSPDLVLETMMHHLELNLSFYGDPLGLILFRKHAVNYLARYKPSSSDKRKLLTLEEPRNFVKHSTNFIINQSLT